MNVARKLLKVLERTGLPMVKARKLLIVGVVFWKPRLVAIHNGEWVKRLNLKNIMDCLG
jgi:hypothetical protein